ncbi:MAG: methyltransferase [Deltaproteobacteria bacterium]|nr:methyltransferase [Deltaproteobacteria bacterium]
MHQPPGGYRYSVDSLLLVDFAATRRARLCLDLGTGSGVVAVELVRRGACERAVGIEAQAELARCARKNADELAGRLEIVEGDLRRIRAHVKPGSFDLVVANPPYHALATGRPSPRPERAAARHEERSTLADFVGAARYALGRGGRLCLVLSAMRLPDLPAVLRSRGLEPKRLRLVHPRSDRPAKLVLCEARAAKPGGVIIEPPLFLA